MDSLLGPAGNFGIAAAHRRGLFQLLDRKRLTAAEICEAHEAEAEAGERAAGCGSVTRPAPTVRRGVLLAEQAGDYLLPASPTYLGSFFDLLTAGDWSFATYRSPN